MPMPSEHAAIQFLHLSDLHYVGATSESTINTNTRRHLDLAVQVAGCLKPAPAFVLISGDLVDGGKLEDYRELKRELERLTIPTFLALGNHDDSGHFAEVFADHASASGQAAIVAGLHIVTLDSHVPQRVYGHLQHEQLDWLHSELARYPELPKIIQLHHPPVFGKSDGSPDEWHHLSAESSEALHRILSLYRVLGVFSGHVHTDQFTLWRGIPCFCTAGLNNTTDVTYQAGLRGVRAASFNLCSVSGGDLRVAAVPLLALEEELFTLSAEQLQKFNPSATSPVDKEKK